MSRPFHPPQRPLNKIGEGDECIPWVHWMEAPDEVRWTPPYSLKGCDGCYNCWQLAEINIIAAANSQKKKIPDNRKRDESQEWAFTLTMPPGHATKEDLIKACENILNKASTNPPQPERADRWAYVVEYTAKGVPHIHGMYHTPSGRALSKKTFKRYWKIYNPSGPGYDPKQPPSGYHAVVRHDQSYADYMTKEGVVVKNKLSVHDINNGSVQEVHETQSEEVHQEE